MKKTILTILLCGNMVIGIAGCVNYDKALGNAPLTKHAEPLFTIITGNKVCVPVQLTVYEDGNYELFTEYKTCRPNQSCNSMLKYSKSIKGIYTYDVRRILDNSVDANSKSYSMDNLPEYELYDKDGHYYTIEKGQTNEYLDEFLKEINVDLKVCANPYYID